MLLLHGLLTCFMVAVMYFDITRYLIPNWLVGIVLLLYAFLLLFAPEGIDWAGALLVAFLAFIAGFVMFTLKWMGGGDIKLLIACMLWTGRTETSIEFVIYTGIIGGFLSLILWAGRPVVAWAAAKRSVPATKIPRLLTTGQPVPYGLAIAGAFLIVLWMGKIPGLPL